MQCCAQYFMAGSYRHVTDKDNNLISNERFPEMIENLGDAYETIEEMWYIIDILANGDKSKIADAHLKYIERVGGDVEYAKSKDFWRD